SFACASIHTATAGVAILSPQFAALDEFLYVAIAADQHPLDEDHGECRPPCPHLQREATTPLTQIASIFEILIFEAVGVEKRSNLLGKRVLTHPDHYDLIGGDSSSDFLKNFCAERRDSRLNGLMNK